MQKTVHLKISRDGQLTIKELEKKIHEIQAQHPDREVFFDGDDFAICSRPRKKKKD